MRCYIPSDENVHTVPAVETLERFARALEARTNKSFDGGKTPAKVPNLPERRTADQIAWVYREKRSLPYKVSTVLGTGT